MVQKERKAIHSPIHKNTLIPELFLLGKKDFSKFSIDLAIKGIPIGSLQQASKPFFFVVSSPLGVELTMQTSASLSTKSGFGFNCLNNYFDGPNFQVFPKNNGIINLYTFFIFDK